MKINTVVRISLTALVLLFVGCTPSAVEVPGINRSNLSAKGEVVGTLPDGREVHRWSVWNPDGNRVHWVYVVDATATTTVNRLEAEGKTQVNKTDVIIINGKKYVPEK